MNQEEMISFIEKKLEERDPFYLQANLKVSGINLSPDDLRALLLARV